MSDGGLPPVQAAVLDSSRSACQPATSGTQACAVRVIVGVTPAHGGAGEVGSLMSRRAVKYLSCLA